MPSPAARRYHDALHDARLQAAALVRDIDAGLIRAYARALLDIQREFRTGAISEDRANLLSGAIRTRLARFGSQVEQVLTSAILQAAEIGVGGHVAGIAPYSHSFEGVAEEAIERMVRRRLLPEVEGAYSSVFRSIIARNLQDVASDIDDYLESAVIRGVSGERAGKELAAIMARNDPEVERIIGRKLKDAPEDALKRARTLMHDAKRIAVHEINSAYDEADKLAAARSPAILAVRWRTSGRHGGLASSPDICDVIEQADVYGMGAGVYPPEYVPSLTHPFCLCSTEKVIRPVEDWGKPKPPLPAMYRNLSRGDVGGLMGRRVNDYSRSVTKKHIERQHELASELIRRAYNTGRQLRATG